MRRTEPTSHSAGHHTLRQIHSIGHREYDELRSDQRRPIEEVIHNILLIRHELVKLVHEHHAAFKSDGD